MGVDATLDLTGGSGLNLGLGKDVAKAVAADGSCSDDAGGGSTVAIDLLPDDDVDATTVSTWRHGARLGSLLNSRS